MYARIENDQVAEYPLTESQIKARFSNTSFVVGQFEPPEGYVEVVVNPQPQIDPMLGVAYQAAPAFIDGAWRVTWIIRPPTEQEIAVAQAALIASYIAEMEAMYDAVAQSRRYDNRITCALRAGYPGPFQAEGQAFALWMDACNALGYQIMAEVMAGTRTLPSKEELLAELPAAPWGPEGDPE